MPHTKTKESPYQIQVLDRAMAILDILAHRGPDLSLQELSEKLSLHKSTTHRLLMVLEQHHLVEKAASTGKYRLGLRLFELGSKAVEHIDMRERARPFLERVMYDTGETVHLCVLDEGEVLYVDKVEPSRSVRMASTVGRRNPVHCTAVGKAMIAYLDEQELDDILRRHGMRKMTTKTLTTPVELKGNLERVRTEKHSVDDEENEEGVRCVGAPVGDYSGRIVAAISVSGPAFRLTLDKVPSVAASVMSAAAALSAELGYPPARNPQLVSAKRA